MKGNKLGGVKKGKKIDWGRGKIVTPSSKGKPANRKEGRKQRPLDGREWVKS